MKKLSTLLKSLLKKMGSDKRAISSNNNNINENARENESNFALNTQTEIIDGHEENKELLKNDDEKWLKDYNEKTKTLYLGMRWLSANDAPGLLNFLHHHLEIISLRLGYNPGCFRAEGFIKILFSLLPQMKNLVELDILRNGIRDKDLKVLAAILPKTNITRLDLSANKIQDKGAKALAAVLPKTKITSLYLDGSLIGNEGAKALAAVLPETNITFLGVSGFAMNIDSTTHKAIKDELNRNKALKFVNQVITITQGARQSQPDDCYLKFLPIPIFIQIFNYVDNELPRSPSSILAMYSLVLSNFGISPFREGQKLEWNTKLDDKQIFRKSSNFLFSKINNKNENENVSNEKINTFSFK